MKKLISLLFLFMSLATLAQKPTLISSKEGIIEAAKKEFETSMSEGGSLKVFATKYNIKGEYYFDITIGDKKRVVTVFAIGNDTDNIKSQNALRDHLKEFSFSTFKVPKDKRYKYEQTFFFE